MSDQTPDSAERIAEDAQLYTMVSFPNWSRAQHDWSEAEIVERIQDLVSAAEERAKAEQAAATRAVLCDHCKAGHVPTFEHGWWYHRTVLDALGEWEDCRVTSRVHAALGTPTGGPDADK